MNIFSIFKKCFCGRICLDISCFRSKPLYIYDLFTFTNHGFQYIYLVRYLQGTVHWSCMRLFLSFYIVARKWWSRSEVDPPLSALLAFVHLHTSWYHTYALHWYLTHFLISHFTHYTDILHLLISRYTHYTDSLHLLISHFHTTLISYTLFDNFNISRISKYKFLIFQISICNLWKPKGEINLVFRLETSDPERG